MLVSRYEYKYIRRIATELTCGMLELSLLPGIPRVDACERPTAAALAESVEVEIARRRRRWRRRPVGGAGAGAAGCTRG